MLAGGLVSFLVLPPLIGAAIGGFGSSFAPLARIDVVASTLIFGVTTTACAILVGGALALMLCENVPGKAVLERLVVLPLYLTPLLTAMGWNWLASPRSGLLNLVLHAGFGGGATINIISPPGAVFVAALAMAPLPFLLISDALNAIDASLIEAARVHGAGARFVLLRVTLPLLLPAALAASLLLFVQSIGLFSVPAVLGVPAGFRVATTEIFQLLENYPPRLADAAAWGAFLLVVSMLLTSIQAILLRGGSFVTVMGKSFRPVRRISRNPNVATFLGFTYVALAAVLPLLALLWAASCTFVPASLQLMQFTARHFVFVLTGYPKTWIAAGNSVLLGVLTASAVCCIGLAASWVVTRRKGLASTVIDQISTIPLSMPAMVFALGLLWVYVRVPLPIYGTLLILLIAYATHYLPVGVRGIGAALRQLHPELEEAARVGGASWSLVMRRITFPLIRPTILASWILLFVLAMQEVSSSILLYSSHSIVLSVAVFDLWENGNPSDVAALGFIQLGASFIVVTLMLALRRRRVVA